VLNDFSDKLRAFYAAPSPVQELVTELSLEKSVRIFVKRDDLIHPLVMGNKWRKLKYNLQTAYSAGIDTLLTFGGAYSNHVIATAYAGAHFGFRTIGIIRGDELSEDSNPRLAEVSNLGMRLQFVDRETYKLRYDVLLHDRLRDLYGQIYVIPEGGNNELALKGTSEVLTELPQRYDYYCCSCGTGNTAAGMALSMPIDAQLLVFPSLSQIKEQESFVRSHAGQSNVLFNTDYLFGGYAKSVPDLVSFISHFPIPLDPVYTSKLFWGVYDLLRKDFFAKNSSVLVYHSGGYSFE
jgi:1-aminocyclopropane-1-carboxylate deaminase